MKIRKDYRPELVASTDTTRPHLTGVYFEADKSRVVATCGHSLVVCPVEPDASDTTGYVPVAALKLARKLSKRVRKRSADGKRWEYSVVPCSMDLGKVAVLRDGTKVLRLDATANKFPDASRVIPKYADNDKTLVRVKFNAAMLADLAEAMGSGHGVVLTFPAAQSGCLPLGPIKVTACDSDNDAFGVLMPMR